MSQRVVEMSSGRSRSLPSVRRVLVVVFQAMTLVVVAIGLYVAYRTSILGFGLSVGLMGGAALALVVGLIRLVRRKAHVDWLGDPFEVGARRYGLRFVVRAALWLTLAYAAVLSFPRALTGAGEATVSYVVIWGSAIVLVLSGLVPPRRVNWLGMVAVGVAVLALGVQLVQIHAPARGVTVGAPVHGTWMVTSGGRSGLISHHFLVPQQRDALDLIIPFARGSSQQPTVLTDYPAYGRLVVSPVDGIVVRMLETLPDQAIGSTDPHQPIGNHVVVEDDQGRYVLLAHLKPASVVVSLGLRVRSGQPVAEVGNSGNSSEPHLHIQVQSGPDLVDDAGVPIEGLVTFPVAFSAGARTRFGETTAGARDLRTNDVVVFP